MVKTMKCADGHGLEYHSRAIDGSRTALNKITSTNRILMTGMKDYWSTYLSEVEGMHSKDMTANSGGP